MRKLTPEEKKQLQAMLEKQSIEQAKKEQELLKHRKSLRMLKSVKDDLPSFGLMGHDVSHGLIGAVVQRDVSQPSPGSKGQELEERKRKKRTGSGSRLKQIELTEKEKRELEARIRGTK